MIFGAGCKNTRDWISPCCPSSLEDAPTTHVAASHVHAVKRVTCVFRFHLRGQGTGQELCEVRKVPLHLAEVLASALERCRTGIAITSPCSMTARLELALAEMHHALAAHLD